MKVLILNSGLGSRLGTLTSQHPKCMTKISDNETILSRQLKILVDAGIDEVIMTTGYQAQTLINYCQGLDLPIHFTFVNNPLYEKTNYIYSIYCAKDYVNDDIILMHGDLVFENEVFENILNSSVSCMIVSSTLPLPKKDFKAKIINSKVIAVGVDITENAMEAQALYYLRQDDWKIWLNKIIEYCQKDICNVYAENALNELEGAVNIFPLDIRNSFCTEIDNQDDLEMVKKWLKESESRTVYMCFSTDIIHGGHISIIKKAQKLGKLIIGVLTDEAVASYKRFPLVPETERKKLFENISGVWKVVFQHELSYKENIEKYHPDIVVHGDDWCMGFQKPIRDEVLSIISSYGGRLVEFPYSKDEKYNEIQARTRADLAMPDIRRARLKKMLNAKGLLTVMEAHDGLTGLIVENTVVYQNGGAHQFDAMWLSSLCDSTAKGKPDIELVDMTSRFRTIEDIAEVTTKPIIFDGDTGGKMEHFFYTVRTLERLGVSMIIIEDKTGLKMNSLFGTEVVQTQDSIENFTAKIRAGKKAQRTKEFMICARIESLILEKGMTDALNRAFAYVNAGADAIMIHSRKKDPSEIIEFIKNFRETDVITPIVLVPTSFTSVTEEEWKEKGANIIIYANQLMRAEVPAIQKVAESILENHRAEECDSMLMPFNEIIKLVPTEY